MKKWNEAAIEELNIEQTAYGVFGWYKDGGRIGDGQVSGHLTFNKNESVEADNNEDDNLTNKLS